MNKNRLRILSAALAAAAILIVVVGLAWNAASAPASQTLQAQAEQEDVEDAQVLKLRQQLSQPGISEEGRQALEEKLAIAERSAAQRAQGQTAAKGDKNAPPPAAAVLSLEEAVEEGIFEGSQGLVSPSQGDIANVWQGQRDGVTYQAFAGSSTEQPAHGILIVVTLGEDRPGGREVYRAPEEVTRLRIREVREKTVILETDTGEQILFDLDAREFSR